MLPLISPPNVPIPGVEPADTNGYWTVTISSSSRIDITWWTADVSPQETLTNDLAVLSINLFNVEYITGLDVVVTYPDSNLALLSAPAGWPATEKRYVPMPDAVEPNPTMFALTSSVLTLSFSTCNLTKLFSTLAVMIPTADWLRPVLVSTYVCETVVSVPSKSTKTSL